MRKKFFAGMLVKEATKVVKKVSPEFKDAIKKHKKLLDKKTNLINQKLIKENIVNSLDMQIPSKDRIIYLNSVK